MVIFPELVETNMKSQDYLELRGKEDKLIEMDDVYGKIHSQYYS